MIVLDELSPKDLLNLEQFEREDRDITEFEFQPNFCVEIQDSDNIPY